MERLEVEVRDNHTEIRTIGDEPSIDEQPSTASEQATILIDWLKEFDPGLLRALKKKLNPPKKRG